MDRSGRTHVMALIGRALISSIFIVSAYSKIVGFQMTAAMMSDCENATPASRI